MVKRDNSDSGADSPYRKRQKLTENQVVKFVPHELQSSQDIQDLLAFKQDNDAEKVKNNIRSFKIFLDAIAYGKDENDQSIKRTILLEYLQSQKPPADDANSRYLSDITQLWSFAAQANQEGLFCSIAAVLALLLKTTSSHIEFRAHGINLCRTLLLDDQIKLFDRGLSANKSKEHVISPCLRLLTEIVSYDGGVIAPNVYAHREVTFKRLEIFLGIRKDFMEAVPESKRRPSVRNNALRYLFANLRLQSRSAKSSILAQGNVTRAVFHDIKEDSAATILEIINAFQKNVLQDLTLSHLVKVRLFTDGTLRSIASLYQYHDEANTPEDVAVHHSVHTFLLCVCTTTNQGILRLQAETNSKDKPVHNFDNHQVDMNRGSSLHRLSQQRLVSQNIGIASFLQSLRPYANPLHCDLILAIFQAAPGLIVDYFLKKSFSFEPKLTTTWVGYAMFLLSTIQLPISHALGNVDIAPPSYIIESILPKPLTKKALTRCLNQSSSLVTFFAVRILVAAFQKLTKALNSQTFTIQAHQDGSSKALRHARLDLIDDFCRRCPEMKHVIAVFRSCPQDSVLFKGAITHLLAMYYKLLPQAALEEKFDISMALSDALKEDAAYVDGPYRQRLCKLELYNLLEIARRSPDMRWWHKPDSMLLSPFTTVLRRNLTPQDSNSDDRVKDLLQSIVVDTFLLNSATKVRSLDILMLSLQDYRTVHFSDPLFEFLDSCILRCVRKPVKYYEDLTALVSTIKPNVGEQYDCNIDLLLITIMEQWPFLVKSKSSDVVAEVTRWIVDYLDLSMHAGGNRAVLSRVRDQLKEHVVDKAGRALLQEALSKPREAGLAHQLQKMGKSSKEKEESGAAVPIEKNHADLDERLIISEMPQADENCSIPRNWSQMDFSDAIEDGEIGRLILCLCSKHEEIRKQAIITLRSFSEQLETSMYSEWQQIYVLVGEVIEVAKDYMVDRPLPHFAGVIAAHSLLVLAEPLHFMYTKINKFLNRSPRWVVDKLPSFWVDKILLHPPADENAHYAEVEWLLEALVDGLRTPDDMELYRRCHILERLLSLSAFSLPKACSQKLMDLLFRCTLAGGSTTLITRCGLLSWVRSRIRSRPLIPSEYVILRRLALRAYESSDQERVNQWSNDGVRSMLDRMERSVTM